LKRPNYNAAKRAREIKQKEKRDAKLARKRAGRGAQETQPDSAAAPGFGSDAGQQGDQGGPSRPQT